MGRLGQENLAGAAIGAPAAPPVVRQCLPQEGRDGGGDGPAGSQAGRARSEPVSLVDCASRGLRRAGGGVCLASAARPGVRDALDLVGALAGLGLLVEGVVGCRGGGRGLGLRAQGLGGLVHEVVRGDAVGGVTEVLGAAVEEHVRAVTILAVAPT